MGKSRYFNSIDDVNRIFFPCIYEKEKYDKYQWDPKALGNRMAEDTFKQIKFSFQLNKYTPD